MMLRRAHIALTVTCAALSACGGGDPCDGQRAACVSTTVDSTVGALDQLAFLVDQPRREALEYPVTPAGALNFPLRLALLFPPSTSNVDVTLQGWNAGQLVGSVDELVTIPANGFGSASFIVGPLRAQDSGVGGDLLSNRDLAFNHDLSFNPDLSSADAQTPIDLSQPDLATNVLKLLIVHTSLKAMYWLDVQSKLMATGSFSTADLFDASTATPTLIQLQAYDTVLVYAQESYADAVTLGDNLADYWDGGGRVVVAPLADSNVPIQGRFGDVNNGYLLISPAGLLQGNDSLGNIVDAASPLVAGVSTLSAQQAYRSSGAAINGGVVVAKWQSGEPLIVRGTVKGRNRVDINMQPPSSDGAGQDGWTGDGAQIMRNALLY